MIGGIVGQYLGTQHLFLTFIPLFILLVILAYRTDIQGEKEIGLVPEKGVVIE
jgi:hypothetical protein